MPFGYLITVSVIIAMMALAVAPVRGGSRLGALAWRLSPVVSESPFVAVHWLLAVSLLALAQGDLAAPAGWGAFAAGCVSLLGAPALVRRSLGARPAIEDALDEGLGPGWLAGQDGLRVRRLPWVRILLAPLPVSRRGVRRTRNISYGSHGRRNRLDVYRPRRPCRGAPILIHLHGGGFHTGRKSMYARPMLHELAQHGWVCLSASYRLRPQAAFPEFMADVKRVVAWAREHAEENGTDPTCIVLAGSSAGAHLALTAALTANDPALQPGFEDADTSVVAAVGLYGYYGRTDDALPSSPADYLRPDAPPVLIAHGDHDTLVSPEHARELVVRLRATSRRPVVYAELPGAQHSFDLVHSVRFHLLIDGIQRFTTATRAAARAEHLADQDCGTTMGPAPQGPSPGGAMQGDVGDRVTVPGRHVGEAERHGEVLEVMGKSERRYRVRWDDGHEAIVVPGAEMRFTHAAG